MADTTIFRAITLGGVRTLQAQNGRTYYKITDDTGLEWTCWDPNVAITANSLAGQGLLQMKVRVAPARDPQYGMNYSLLAIAPAPPGAQPTPPGQEQVDSGMPQAQTQMQPNMFPTMQQPQQMPQQQLPQLPQQPVPQAGQMPQIDGVTKTMGQGGNMSDADLTRMARSTAIEAVVGVAFKQEDFRDAEENVDWMRVYAAAEAVSKFITQRAHQGWVPGVELDAPERPAGNPSNEQQVLAEVQAQFGEGLVQEGFSAPPEQVPVAEASADNAQGGEHPWGQ